jgi:hypothetical protein
MPGFLANFWQKCNNGDQELPNEMEEIAYGANCKQQGTRQ